MQSEFINLLPPDRLRAFRRAYFLRLATVGSIALTILIVAHGILLAPSYLYLSGQVSSHEKELAALEARLAQSGEQGDRAELALLETGINRLAKLQDAPSASAVVSAILAVPRSGISLSSFVFEPPSSEKEGRLVLSGVSKTRDALRAYVATLSALPFVKKVDLPIGVYAQESDLTFVLTLSGSLIP